MTFAVILASVVFAVGYLAIALEHNTHVNKAPITLVMAGILWFIASLVNPTEISHALTEAGSEIFGITIFLLAAMSLVEILIHYRIFDVIRAKMLSYNITQAQQFVILGAVAFFLSAIVDNLTATIIAVQIARKFFWGRNLLVMMVAIVILANAGGAFSPIGDITTIMLWIAGKFGALEIITRAFLPSLALALVAGFMLKRKIVSEAHIEGADTAPVDVEPMTRSEKLITVTALVSFFFPILAKSVHLPPVVGILFGLGVTWILVEVLKHISPVRTHLTASIENLVQKTDIASIKFFVGILLSVAALHTLGVLNYISTFVYGEVQTTSSIIVGNVAMGMISSVLDNIPLTAIVITILETANTDLWILLAIAVGTGGSLLSVGSAAGVVAMGMNKDLTFMEYVKIGFIPALVSFAVAIGVWGVQTKMFPLGPTHATVVNQEMVIGSH